jgi:5'-phosphate synthase pdxT subunit
VFIRAPAIMSCGPSVEVLADITAASPQGVEQADGNNRVMVAVRQGHLLGTAFHPELTADLRWHALFVQMCEENDTAARALPAATETLPLTRPTVPLPVIGH